MMQLKFDLFIYLSSDFSPHFSFIFYCVLKMMDHHIIHTILLRKKMIFFLFFNLLYLSGLITKFIYF